MRFIGREKELGRINKVLENSKQSNILIYGRWRIGKSSLIKKALENRSDIVIHYQCRSIAYQSIIAELNDLININLKLPYNVNFASIDEILDFLFKYKEKIILVLDEYPYMISKIEGINSIIQSKIDLNKDESQLKLILSGSQIDIMKEMIEYSNPLYGRFDDVIEVKEHNYLEASLYYPSYSNEDKVMLYAIFGGEPLYNSWIDEKISPLENVMNVMIKENSIAEININSNINLELSKIKYGNDVLLAIACGAKKNEEIVTKAHATSSSDINNALNKLLSLDFIKKVVPINDENNHKKTLYYLNCNSLQFYYKYLYKYSSQRSNMNIYEYYEKLIKDDLYNKLIPSVFENITKQYLIIKNKRMLNKTSFQKIGTYWYDDKINKNNGQFDVVTYDEYGYIFYEVKYTNAKIDKKIISEEILQLSKTGINYYNLGFVSKNGFDNVDGNYILISLDDIYSIK